MVHLWDNKCIWDLIVKRPHALLGVLSMKLAYVPSCIRPEVTLITSDQRILCSGCGEKMYYGCLRQLSRILYCIEAGRLGLCAWNFEFLKNTGIFLFLISIFHEKRESETNRLHEAALLKRNNFEELSRYKIGFLWIAINLHWNDCLLSYKYSISIDDSNAKTNVNALVIIYTNCWNLVTILRLRNFKVVMVFCWKGNFFLWL